jgi:hypothetical protein
MNFNMLSIVKNANSILKQWLFAVCIVSCTLTLCLQSACSKKCSQEDPRGTCSAGKTCLLNGKTYGCYGRCTESSFGSCFVGQNCLLNDIKYGCYGRCTRSSFGACSKNEVCLVSLIRISKNLEKTAIYACFTCTDDNPLGTCPAGKSCFTCNGASTCVTDDFTCKESRIKAVSAENPLSTTMQVAPIPVAMTTQVTSPPATTTPKAK